MTNDIAGYIIRDSERFEDSPVIAVGTRHAADNVNARHFSGEGTITPADADTLRAEGFHVCEECGIVTSDGVCLNVGTCYRADVAAVPAPGDRLKSPRAFTISGAID